MESAVEALALREKVAQLETALETRIAIEQAKGILAERYGLTVADAFELLRYSARSARVSVQSLARKVEAGARTPDPVLVGMARQQRWRAAAQRERAELQRERAHEKLEHAAELAARLRREQG